MCVLLILLVSGRLSVLVARLFPSVGRTPLLSAESWDILMFSLLYFKTRKYLMFVVHISFH